MYCQTLNASEDQAFVFSFLSLMESSFAISWKKLPLRDVHPFYNHQCSGDIP